MNVLAAGDPLDPATAELRRPADYTSFLDRDGLKGARIGVPSDPSDPANDFYYGPLPQRAVAVMRETIAVLEREGATVVRANIPTEGWIGGPGTEMAILNRNPESPTKNQPARRPIVFVYELKHDLNLYLRDWAAGTGMASLADIIAFNAEHADGALRFGQDIFLAAEATRGDLSELEYVSARQMDLRASRTLGLDAYMDEHRLDAVLFPAATGAAIAAKAGYPSVQVPAGFVAGIRDKETPDYPYGATFTGRFWSEPILLRLAYAFEQATQARRPPPGLAVVRFGLCPLASLAGEFDDAAGRLFYELCSRNAFAIAPMPAGSLRRNWRLTPTGRMFWSWRCRVAGCPSVLTWLGSSARRSMFFWCASWASLATRSWRWARWQPATSAFSMMKSCAVLEFRNMRSTRPRRASCRNWRGASGFIGAIARPRISPVEPSFW